MSPGKALELRSGLNKSGLVPPLLVQTCEKEGSTSKIRRAAPAAAASATPSPALARLIAGLILTRKGGLVVALACLMFKRL